MTTRHYKCTRCHHEWGAHQSPLDENLVFCPWCDKPTAEAVKGMEEEG